MKDGIKKVYKNGNQFWKNEKGLYHRLNNKPAVIWDNGYKEYRVNGKRHRTNGPAIIYPDGNKECYINGIYQKLPDKETLWICNKVKI